VLARYIGSIFDVLIEVADVTSNLLQERQHALSVEAIEKRESMPSGSVEGNEQCRLFVSK